MIRNTRALVLWSKRSREADKIVGFFTRDFGRVTARATSAARSTAKFAALTEPFVESEIAYFTGRDQSWGKLVGGRLHRCFPAVRQDLQRSTAAAWMCEIMARLTPPEQPSPEKYDLLSDALAALESAADFDALRLAFAIRFLGHAGFAVDHAPVWQQFQAEAPERARWLREAPLQELDGGAQEVRDHFDALAQLAGRLVTDQLNYPLAVNRFRQLSGVTL